MGKLFGLSWGSDKNVLTEEIKAFSKTGNNTKNIKKLLSKRGEGWENLSEIPGFELFKHKDLIYSIIPILIEL